VIKIERKSSRIWTKAPIFETGLEEGLCESELVP